MLYVEMLLLLFLALLSAIIINFSWAQQPQNPSVPDYPPLSTTLNPFYWPSSVLPSQTSFSDLVASDITIDVSKLLPTSVLIFNYSYFRGTLKMMTSSTTSTSLALNGASIIFTNCRLTLHSGHDTELLQLSGNSFFLIEHSVIVVDNINSGGDGDAVGIKLRVVSSSSSSSTTSSLRILNNNIARRNKNAAYKLMNAVIDINIGRLVPLDDPSNSDTNPLYISAVKIENNSFIIPFDPSRSQESQSPLLQFLFLSTTPLQQPSPTNFDSSKTTIFINDYSVSNNYIHLSGRLTLGVNYFSGTIFTVMATTTGISTIWRAKNGIFFNNNLMVVNFTARSEALSGTNYPQLSAIRVQNVMESPLLSVCGNNIQQLFTGDGGIAAFTEMNTQYFQTGFRSNIEIVTFNPTRSNITLILYEKNSVYAEGLFGAYGLFLSLSFSNIQTVLFNSNTVKMLRVNMINGIGMKTCDTCSTDYHVADGADLIFAPALPIRVSNISYLNNNLYYTRLNGSYGGGDVIKVFISDSGREAYDVPTQFIGHIEVAFNKIFGQAGQSLNCIALENRVEKFGPSGIHVHHNDMEINGIGNWASTIENPLSTSAIAGLMIRSHFVESMTSPIVVYSNGYKFYADRGQSAALLIDSQDNSPTTFGWGKLQDVKVFVYDNDVHMHRIYDAPTGDLYFCGVAISAHKQAQSFGSFEGYNNNFTILADGQCPFSGCIALGLMIMTSANSLIKTVGLIKFHNNFVNISTKGTSGGFLLSLTGQQTMPVGALLFSSGVVYAEISLLPCQLEYVAGAILNNNKFFISSPNIAVVAVMSLVGTVTKLGTFVVTNNEITLRNPLEPWLLSKVPSDPYPEARSRGAVFGIGCFSQFVMSNRQDEKTLQWSVLPGDSLCTQTPIIRDMGDLSFEGNSFAEDKVDSASLIVIAAAVNFTGDILIRNISVGGLDGSFSRYGKGFPIDFMPDPRLESNIQSLLPITRDGDPTSANSRIKNISIINCNFELKTSSCSSTIWIPHITVLNAKGGTVAWTKTFAPLVANPGLLNAPMYQIQNMKIDGVSVTFADVCQINPTRANTSKFTVFTFDRLASRPPLQSSSSQLPPARINITNFIFSISSSTAKDVGVNLINVMNTDSEKAFATSPQVVSITLKNVSIFNTNYDLVNRRGSFSAHDQLYSVQNPTSIPSPLLQLVVPCTKWNDRFIFASDKVVKQSLPFPAVAPAVDLDIRYCMPNSKTRTETHLASRSQELTPSTSVSSSQSKTLYDKSVHNPTLPLSPGANTALSIGSAVTFPTAAQNAFKAIALTRLRACFNDSYRYQPLDVDSNILMLSLGQNDELTSYRGAVVGNLIFTFFIFLFFVSLSVGFLGVKRYLREKQLQKIREEKKRKQENDEELQQVLLATNNITINNSELNDAVTIPEEMSFLNARELFRIPGVVFPVIIVVGMPSIMAVTVLATVPNHLDFDIVLSIPSIILFGIIFVGIGSWCAIKCDGSCGMKKRKTEQLIWTIEGFTQELKDRKKAAVNNYIENNRKDDTNNNNNNKNKYVKPPKLTKYEYELKERIYQKKKKKEQEELERVLENNPKSCPKLRAIWSFVYRIIAFAIFEPKEWKETSFVLQFGIMFDSYTMVIFCVIDYVTAALIAISSGISMTCSEVSCCNVAGSLAIVICFIYMLLILYFRPYLMRVERWMNCAMVVVTFISSCLVLAELNELGVTDILDGFAELSVALSFITVVFGMQPLLQSMFVVFWRMYKRKRREARRNGERRNGGGGGSNSWNIFGDSLGARRHRRLASLAGSDGGDGEEIEVVVPIVRSQPRSLQSSAVPTRRSSVSKSTSSKSSPPTTLSSSSRKSSNLSQIKPNFDNNNNNTSKEAVEISQLLLAPLPVRSSPKSVVSSNVPPSSFNQQSRSRSGTRERENSMSSPRLPRNEYPGSNNNNSNHSSVRRNSSSSSPRSQKGSSSSVVRPSNVSNVRRSSTSSHNNNSNQEKEQMKTKQTIEAIQKKNQERFANL